MAEMKYVKFSDGYVFPATQVEASVRNDFIDESSIAINSLTIQRESTDTTSLVDEYAQKITEKNLDKVEVYADEACKKLLMTYTGYTHVRGIALRVAPSGNLYDLNFTKKVLE